MAEMTFNDLIAQLTTEHPVMVETDNGSAFPMAPALLVQLREAVFGGMESGGGSSFGSKLPMDAAAVDLLTEITNQAAEVLAFVSHQPTPYGHAESYVALWAAQTLESTPYVVTSRATPDEPDEYGRRLTYDQRHEYTAHQLAQHWVNRIRDFFNPPKMRDIPNACPVEECGARFIHRNVDGEMKQSAALRISIDRGTGRSIEAKCGVCGKTWEPEEFLRLAATLSYAPPAE